MNSIEFLLDYVKRKCTDEIDIINGPVQSGYLRRAIEHAEIELKKLQESVKKSKDEI